MKHITFIALVVAGATAIGTGAAMAKSPAGHGMRTSFETMDANSDGQVTQAEMEAVRANRFNEVDTDGDGILTRDELVARSAARAEARADRMLKALDKDGDGSISAAELPEPRDMGERFSRLDKDSSGGISKEEFDAARKAHRKNHDGEGKKRWKKQQQDQD